MALDVAGRHDRARGRVRVATARTQNPDGSWYRSYRTAPDDLIRESNFSAYLAVGLLHHVRRPVP